MVKKFPGVYKVLYSLPPWGTLKRYMCDRINFSLLSFHYKLILRLDTVMFRHSLKFKTTLNLSYSCLKLEDLLKNTEHRFCMFSA